MKGFRALHIVALSTTLISHFGRADDAFPRLTGPWFGQTEPGLVPELFAPDLISKTGRYEFGISFSPGLDELYFTALSTGEDEAPEIHYSKIEAGYWSQPKKANFSNGKLVYELLPHVSLDDDRLYFSGRLTQSRESNGIWYVTRHQQGWSEPQRLDVAPEKGRLSDFNTGNGGDVIFTNMPERKVYTAKRVNGQLSVPVPLEIGFGVHGFISPEQDYLLVNAREHDDEQRRDSDLFVCFRQDDGSWSTPIRLGNQINTPHSETVARVSPDGKYLFFGRYNEPGRVSNLYWVSTQVIDDVRKTHFDN